MSIISSMDNYEKNYLSQRPQSLCKMCGRCCRVATTSIPYSELKRLAEQGDKPAIDFLSIFVPYSSIEEARSVDSEIVDNIIERLSQDGNYDEKNTTFYYCQYIQDNNLCSNYENRPLLCQHCPSTPWSIVPPGCGFEGWLFMKREEIKQKIRKSKEDFLELELLRCKTTNEETLAKINLVQNKIRQSINLYKKYGAENW